MPATPVPVRIGIFGPEYRVASEGRGCGLWTPGYTAAVTAAGGEPVALGNGAERVREEQLEGLHGLVLTGHDLDTIRQVAEGERLCGWCRRKRLPLLAVDHGLHILNLSGGGTLYLDLPRELPEALQHRHPPEQGLRHAIEVARNTRLAKLYGDGEIVVNSEHRRAICRLARGFRVSARALDGVIEAIEAEGDDWFALGVQWQPASATASGLDIQLFRGLVEMSTRRMSRSRGASRTAAKPRARARQLVSA
jgi:putative glutamine amidotransferase